MTKRFNWGILGTSFISGVVADAIREEGTTSPYSVAGRSTENVQEFAGKYDVEKVHEDYEALIADERVDIVYIALPNHVHHEFVVKAADAGKAILCEKSLSIDMGKTQQALEAVERNSVFFAEGLMYLTHPLASKVLEVLASGSLGELRAISGRYCAAISDFVNPGSRGALYNLGCYPASLAHLVLQEICGDQVFDDYAITSTGRRGRDDNICEAAASLQFGDGVVCQLHTAEDYGLHAEFTVFGSKGSLEMRTNPWLPDVKNQLAVTRYEQVPEIIEVPAVGDGFLYEVRQVREALELGRIELSRPAVRPSDSAQIMTLLTRWEQACEKGMGGR